MTIVVCGAQSRTDRHSDTACVCGTGLGGWGTRIFHTIFCFRYSLCVPCLAALRLARLALGACTLFVAKFTVFKVYVNLLQLFFVNGMYEAWKWIQQAKAALIHVVLFRRGIRCRKMIFTDGDFKN